MENQAERAGDGTVLALDGDDEIVITRTFAAPAALVFEALTTPEHVRRWWAPRSRGTVVSVEIDRRVGGAWRYVMRTHDGHEVGFSGRFLEIEAPTRIVNTEVFDPFPDLPATVSVTLSEQDGRTTMTSRSRYPSKEVRDMVLATGMEGGMRESMRQLSEAVATLQ